LGSNHFEGEELVVTHVSLLPNSEDQCPDQAHFDIPSQDVVSPVDGIAFNELVVIECQTPCQEYDYLVFEEERGQPEVCVDVTGKRKWEESLLEGKRSAKEQKLKSKSKRLKPSKNHRSQSAPKHSWAEENVTPKARVREPCGYSPVPKQATSRSGRVLKPPQKFLQYSEELNKEEAKRISLQDIGFKKVCVRLPKLPQDKLKKFSVEENNNSSPHISELGVILENRGPEGHDDSIADCASVGNENNFEIVSTTVNELLQSWTDWESEKTFEVLEKPWRPIESDFFTSTELDTMLVPSEEYNSVVGHEDFEKCSDGESLISENSPVWTECAFFGVELAPEERVGIWEDDIVN